MSKQPLKTWQCRTRGYSYDEAEGDAMEDLAVGTHRADLHKDWICRTCSL